MEGKLEEGGGAKEKENINPSSRKAKQQKDPNKYKAFYQGEVHARSAHAVHAVQLTGVFGGPGVCHICLI